MRFEEKLGCFYYISVIILVVFGATALINHHRTFFTDAILSICVITFFYRYHKKVVFSLPGAVLCLAGWVMNTAGALGAYEISFYGIGWDKLLHLISCAGITLLSYAYLSKKTSLSTTEKLLITLFIVEGFGALNEIGEFIGSYYFGIGQGLLGMMNGISPHATVFEMFDTQWDLITNTISTLLTIAYIKFKPVSKHASSSKSAILHEF